MAAVVAAGVDAARVTGKWWDATWPAATRRWGRMIVPVRLLGLDHAIVLGPAAVAAYQSFELPGSDHDALLVDIVTAPA